MKNEATTETGNKGNGKMITFAEVKKQIKGCTTVYWRAGCDTIDSSTGRRAHKILAECIAFDEQSTIGAVNVIGKTAWIDEQSWVEAH